MHLFYLKILNHVLFQHFSQAHLYFKKRQLLKRFCCSIVPPLMQYERWHSACVGPKWNMILNVHPNMHVSKRSVIQSIKDALIQMNDVSQQVSVFKQYIDA